MIRRVLTALPVVAVIVVAGLLLPGAAVAAPTPYPPGATVSISASTYDPCAGADNIIGGNGFQPGETIELTLAKTGVIARPVVGADGTWQITITIPLSERGSDQLTAVGLTSGLSASTQLAFPCVVGQSTNVTPISGGAGGSGGSGGLAYTGVVVGAALALGIALLLTGTAFVVLGRRRRRVHTA